MAEYIRIPLTRGLVTLLDADDEHLVAGRSWCAVPSPLAAQTWYAQSHEPGTGKHGKSIRMHQAILKVPPGWHVDHINGDGLDNRRANLRPSTPSQNAFNSALFRHNTSGFRGVSFDRRYRRPWLASIKIDGKFIRLGRFDSAEEAALAFDEAARQFRGEFARFNFPRVGELGVRSCDALAACKGVG